MHPGDVLYNPATLLRLRAELGPVIGCNFDPSHLFWQGIDPPQGVRDLGTSIYLFQLKDTGIQEHNVLLNGIHDTTTYPYLPARAWNFRTVGYGHDELWWRDFVSTLRMIGYDDVVSIEHEDDLMSVEEGLSKAVTLLQGVLIEKPVGTRFWQ
jgi:sugar phosphate isomerase/epimerase